MMLTLSGPAEQLGYEISSLEIETSLGHFVILENHAPILLLVKPNSSAIITLINGEKKTIPLIGGILHVTKDNITLILAE